MHAIRITEVPPGEAPLEVRKAWLGLVLPLSGGRSTPKRIPVAGVMSGPKSFFEILWGRLTFKFAYCESYQVDVLSAVEVLEKTSPDAAGWWRQNTPHMVRRGRRFGFPVDCCEQVEIPSI